HFVSLISMAIAYLIMVYSKNNYAVMFAMGLAGIGWSSVLALPFAMLSTYIKEGSEGAVMGIFNIFISAPQVLVCTVLAWFIDRAKYSLNGLPNNHWEYAFLIGAIMLIISAFMTLTIKENK
ncbi:MFS transporter, partial [bacterium]|nr:MFS transporter [bacterium]